LLDIFICEDSSEFLYRIEKIVGNCIKTEKLNATIACTTTHPKKILQYIKQNKVFGLYFLDLDLKCDMNGFQLADEIRKHDPRAFIVIITSDSESKSLSFEYIIEAMDYITKGIFNFEERICNCLCTAHSRYTERNKCMSEKLCLKLSEDTVISGDTELTRGSTVYVDFADILFIETTPSKTHQIIVNCISAKYMSRNDLNKVISLLDEKFVRCHKSFIVNVGKILNFNPDKRKLWLTDGTVLDMGGVYVEHVRNGLNALYARLNK